MRKWVGREDLEGVSARERIQSKYITYLIKGRKDFSGCVIV